MELLQLKSGMITILEQNSFRLWSHLLTLKQWLAYMSANSIGTCYKTERAMDLKEWSNQKILIHFSRSDATIRRCWHEWMKHLRSKCREKRVEFAYAVKFTSSSINWVLVSLGVYAHLVGKYMPSYVVYTIASSFVSVTMTWSGLMCYYSKWKLLLQIRVLTLHIRKL